MVLCLWRTLGQPQGCRDQDLPAQRVAWFFSPHTSLTGPEAHWSLYLTCCSSAVPPHTLEQLFLAQTRNEMRILHPFLKIFPGLSRYTLWIKQGHLLSHPACFQAPPRASRQKQSAHLLKSHLCHSSTLNAQTKSSTATLQKQV